MLESVGSFYGRFRFRVQVFQHPVRHQVAEKTNNPLAAAFDRPPRVDQRLKPAFERTNSY